MSVYDPKIIVGVTCPFCEYQNGGTGHVKATGDGSFTCGECGSFWRDLNPACTDKSPMLRMGEDTHSHDPFSPDLEQTGHDKSKGKLKCSFDAWGIKPVQAGSGQARDCAKDQTISQVVDQPVAQAKFEGENETSNSSIVKTAAPASLLNLTMLGTTAFGLVVAVFAGLFWFANPDANAVTRGDILIEDVSFRRSGSGNEELVWVQGTMVNRTSRSHSVPKLRLVLKSHNRGEVMSWTYTSATASLEPGNEVQFTTLMASAGMSFDSIEVLQAD